MKTKVELIKEADKELMAAWSKIGRVNLVDVVPAKFQIRQHKITTELRAFVFALRRQIAPAKKHSEKVARLQAQLKTLEQEYAGSA